VSNGKNWEESVESDHRGKKKRKSTIRMLGSGAHQENTECENKDKRESMKIRGDGLFGKATEEEIPRRGRMGKRRLYL